MISSRTAFYYAALFSGLALLKPCQAQQTIKFAGVTWSVRSTYGGPGPNYFSADNVSVDDLGRLHLKISKNGSQWNCAEVYTTQYTTYGEHRFLVEGRVDLMDRNQVLGLFIYASDTREVDIEFSRWGYANESQVGSYTIQPGSAAHHFTSFVCHLDSARSTHYFNWQPDSITFASMHGHYLHEPAAPAEYIFQHTYKGEDIPLKSYNMRTHINFWLVNGTAPLDPRYLEVIITDMLLPGVAHTKVEAPAGEARHKIGNYPNPFNDETIIELTSPTTDNMLVQIYNATGENVWHWQGQVAAGENRKIHFSGLRYAAGIYFCRISGSAEQSILKLLLLH
jgi:hypothetical protein